MSKTMKEYMARFGRAPRLIGGVVILLILFPYVMALLFCHSWLWFDAPMEQETAERYVVVRGEAITVEDYVEGVLPGLLCDSMEPELIKAMAIILRTDVYAIMGDALRIGEEELPFTYLVSEQIRNLSIFDETSDVYVTYEEYVNRIQLAVDQTRGQVYQLDGKCTFLPFCVASNGRTRYLEGVTKCVECEEDLQAEGAVWCISYTPAEVLSIMYEAGWISGEEYDNCIGLGEHNCLTAEDLAAEYDKSGYMTRVIYQGKISIEGSVFAKAMSLPSESVWIQDYNGMIRFTGAGIGSGYGLCIYSAGIMAEQGASCSELLLYYYCK